MRGERRHDPADRAIQVIEGFLGDHGRKFAGKSTDARVFVKQNHFAGFLHCFEHSFAIERQQRSQVEHFQIDPHFLEFAGRVQSNIDHGAVRDD